jgi:hypothetical protein
MASFDILGLTFRSGTPARARIGLVFVETGKNLGVRQRYPPVLNYARCTGPVAR